MIDHLINRAGDRAVALETTLVAHGVPAGEGLPLSRKLNSIICEEGAEPALVGVLHGMPIIGMTDQELGELLNEPSVLKTNTANLGVAIHRGISAATTVSATMELAAAASVRMFATGGIGGVHRGFSERLDISSDLTALTRFPVAVVASGVKSILDVVSTREALETLGVPVIGYQTDEFPAFYLRTSGAEVDARFDDADELAGFIASELTRTGRGVLIVNPIPVQDEIAGSDWRRWLDEAQVRASAVPGRDATPALLAALHQVSGGATLRANIALVESNARLAARLAASMPAGV